MEGAKSRQMHRWTVEEKSRLERLREQYTSDVPMREVVHAVRTHFPDRSYNAIAAKLYAIEKKTSHGQPGALIITDASQAHACGFSSAVVGKRRAQMTSSLPRTHGRPPAFMIDSDSDSSGEAMIVRKETSRNKPGPTSTFTKASNSSDTNTMLSTWLGSNHGASKTMSANKTCMPTDSAPSLGVEPATSVKASHSLRAATGERPALPLWLSHPLAGRAPREAFTTAQSLDESVSFTVQALQATVQALEAENRQIRSELRNVMGVQERLGGRMDRLAVEITEKLRSQESTADDLAGAHGDMRSVDDLLKSHLVNLLRTSTSLE
ncbi:hypothetical protein BDW66DRAFT_155419 [Aspergillus desertorum]